MSTHSVAASRRSFGSALGTASIVAALGLLGTCTTAGAAAAGAHGASAAPCIATAKGAAWSYKGHKGTAYTLLGENGASCSLGAKWLKRIITSHGTKSPAGWKCLSTPPVGECQTKGGDNDKVGRLSPGAPLILLMSTCPRRRGTR
jgi:hypothetical protein